MKKLVFSEPKPAPLDGDNIVQTEVNSAENRGDYPLYYYFLGGALLGLLASKLKGYKWVG